MTLHVPLQQFADDLVDIAAGTEVARVEPGSEQVWEALRALYFVGRKEDLPLIRRYTRESAETPDRLRQQAALTEKAILERAAKPDPAK